MSGKRAESPEELKIRSTTEALIKTADRLGLVMSADVWVNKEGAAALLSCSRPHLQALRQGGELPMHYSIGVDGGRVSISSH